MNKLHDKINRIHNYLDLIAELGDRFHKGERARVLRSYLEDRLGQVAQEVQGLPRPRVYYAMSSPFFALNEERFEIELATLAGGHCVNRFLTRSGKPGVNISLEELLHLDPEHIFISGLFSSTVEEFRLACRENGIWVDAVCCDQIHVMPPGWDFGNPRWVLGLMQIANILHPDHCRFDLEEETKRFYEVFYQSTPADFIANRSFYQAPAGTAAGFMDGLPREREMAIHA